MALLCIHASCIIIIIIIIIITTANTHALTTITKRQAASFLYHSCSGLWPNSCIKMSDSSGMTDDQC